MRILDRYVFREILAPTLIGLLALTFVVFSQQIGRPLEIMVRQSATLAEFWAISAAIIPAVLTFTIPMAVLVGILTGFGRMSSDSEAIAFRASGISMLRLLLPVMALAVIGWTANIAVTGWLAPRMTARLNALIRDIAVRQVALDVKPRVFNEDLTNFVLYVQEIEPDNMHWRGIMLADLSHPEDPRVTFAKAGSLVRSDETQTFQLNLIRGSTHSVSPLAPQRYSFTQFDTTTIQIPIPEAPPAPEKSLGETGTGDLWNRVRTGSASHEEQVEFHRRIALPFACFSFALIGLALGVSTTRGSKSVGLVLSLLLMLIYYLVLIGGTRIAGNGQLSPFIGTWLANIGFAILGIVLLARSDREYENRIVARLASAMQWASVKTSSVRLTRSRVSRWAYSLTHHPKFFRLLDIYVLRGFWFFFGLVLIVFVALFIVITLFELLPDIVKNNIDTSIVIRYFLFLLPQIVYWVAPLTVLLAILINLGTLTKTNEILAVKAGAISLYRMSLPLVVMGLLLSASIYCLQDFVLPQSNQRQDQYRNIIKGRAPQTYRDPLRKWIVGSDDRIYNYNYFDPNADLFGNISIFEFEPNTLELKQWIFARRAEWKEAQWVFENGWVRLLGLDHEEYWDYSLRNFPEMESPDYFKKEVRTAAQMTYGELKRYVINLQQSGFDVSSLTVDLYRKLSFPLVCFIMALIGVPFSFTTGKRGAFHGIGICLVLGIVYWGTFELFDKLGGINRLSPLIAAWFPNLIFGVSGVWMMLRVKT
jgi:LPS export ABC transporter permease LptF/LPS export ABC transporter permease LptG